MLSGRVEERRGSGMLSGRVEEGSGVSGGRNRWLGIQRGGMEVCGKMEWIDGEVDGKWNGVELVLNIK